ncbi:hypothetical protein CJP74_04710 [Psittacicella melopsittaci]|uniref:Filamentous haemagglutinin FhaB/tRNA nuclease CdiA-like TPS domain-containing protein n=1 Tax=Psittacicella melopsittaci TaxID=2028576 RepID=A0A3A1Y4Q1_9GAMM|nr:hypothetical protein CJP74_04710 [Psittacicella melopsittaci]
MLGGSVSQIIGTLESNGKVFIVNPAGIVFGANSVVNVQSLVASTLDISNEDFVKGNYVFNQDKDQAIASVINQGLIKVNDDGTLALVGGKVVNNGILEAKNGTVYLLAGQSITIQDLDNPLISYKVTADNKAVNLGEIVSKRAYLLANKVANGYTSASQFADVISASDSARKATITANGEVLLYGASESELVQQTNFTDAQLAANISNQSGLVVINGTINASNAAGTGGTVTVLGDTVSLESSALVDASGNQGGQVYLGGDLQGTGELKLAANTSVAQGAVVNVSGNQGDAGKAISWGNTANYDGSFYATSVNGNGGFIETSGNSLSLGTNVFVDTRSTYGTTGNWLLDPDSILVVNSSPSWSKINTFVNSTSRNYSASNLTSLSGPEFSADDAVAARTRATYTFITDSDIQTYLKTTGVTLTARKHVDFYYVNITATDAGAGDLTVYARQFVNFTESEINLSGSLNIYDGNTSPAYFNVTDSCITAANIRYTNSSSSEAEVVGIVNINNSTLNATSGGIYLNTSDEVTIENASKLYATNITIHGSEITIQNDDTLLCATDVTVNGTGKLKVTDNAKVNATATVSFYTQDSELEVDENSEINSDNITLNASKVNVTDATLNGTNNLTITAAREDGDRNEIFIKDNAVLKAANISINAGDSSSSLSIENTQLTASNNASLTSTSVEIKGSTFKVDNHLEANASSELCVTSNSEVNASTINFTAGVTLNVDSSNITAKKDLSLCSTTSGINLISSNLSAQNVNVSSNLQTTVSNSTLNGTTSVNLNVGTTAAISSSSKLLSANEVNVKAGSIEVNTSSEVNATIVNATSTGSLTIDSAKVVGTEVDLNASSTATIRNGSNVNGANNTNISGRSVTVTGQNTLVNGSNIKVVASESIEVSSCATINATKNASLNATRTLTISCATVKSPETSLHSGQGITINRSNVSGENNLTITSNSGNTNVSNSNLSSTNVTVNVSTLNLCASNVNGTKKVLVNASENLNVTGRSNITSEVITLDSDNRLLVTGNAKVNATVCVTITSDELINVSCNSEINSPVINITGKDVSVVRNAKLNSTDSVTVNGSSSVTVNSSTINGTQGLCCIRT